MSKIINTKKSIDPDKVIFDELISFYGFKISTSDFKLIKHEYNGYGHYLYFQKIINLPNGIYNDITFTIDDNILCGIILWVDDEQVLIEVYPLNGEKMPEKFAIKKF
ncbi:hypothetical protein [Arenimonas sp.]|jgi:hypothetical protein|uniref:hypothetical protein n=1 Tax=Arenimonas sp. TaxID=1872635 RepID=UPI0037BF4425